MVLLFHQARREVGVGSKLPRAPIRGKNGNGKIGNGKKGKDLYKYLRKNVSSSWWHPGLNATVHRPIINSSPLTYVGGPGGKTC